MIPTYPEYEHRISREFPDVFKYEYEFRCGLRLLHDDGKYYLALMVYKFTAKDFETAVSSFIRQAYIYLNFYKVDTNVFAPDGIPLFRLDPDQRSELERLKLLS